MHDIVNWLKDTGDYKTSAAYTTITKHYSEADSKSIALRLLIHFMGDVHQPLHAMNRLDSSFPTGDAGGNAFPLTYHYDVDELHALWDTVIYENHNSYKLPFTSDTWVSFGTETNAITTKYSFTSSEINNVDFYKIAADSFAIGTATAYKGVNMNDVVPQAYQDANKPIAEKQLTIAGLRLAHLMTTIFPNTPVAEVAPVEEVSAPFMEIEETMTKIMDTIMGALSGLELETKATEGV
jgi:hypothetical protein